MTCTHAPENMAFFYTVSRWSELSQAQCWIQSISGKTLFLSMRNTQAYQQNSILCKGSLERGKEETRGEGGGDSTDDRSKEEQKKEQDLLTAVVQRKKG